ncbi:hypothetical protein H632_c2774p1 [Helicosporidium sp. ATCC 50920]|nr:hypothetical protein H632_c2774p1 [Helicosporidium sp. ATCC 50920]|eukprot:KDD72888.1 hypothetical protein H632_c2774p1 [Helicosporidium sp. ATCC 50920]
MLGRLVRGSGLTRALAQARTPWAVLGARDASKQANDLRTGNVIELNERLLEVIKFQHVNSGRQSGLIQLELRDLKTRNKQPAKFRPSDSVEVAHIEDRPFSVLYREGALVHVMDARTFEQMALDVELFGGQEQYLIEGMEVAVAQHSGQPVLARVPPTVTLVVAEAAPAMKGETAAPSYKPAVLSNGLSVSVPPFVNQGDAVVVDTASNAFVRRA